MLGMNRLLLDSGVPLEKIRYVRHQDGRYGKDNTPYALWALADGSFERYQALQSRNVFEACDWVVSCVVTPLGETLFVGIYEILHKGFAESGVKDPMTGKSAEGHFLYEMVLDERLRDLIGRLVLDWGPGTRSWVQRADNKDKPIIELRRSAIEPPFPGFEDFIHPISQLASVPVSWRAALSAVSGVYLLTCRKTGRHYVGSAYGAGGFWARWEEYLLTGHGGNVGLRMLDSHDFNVSILEVASSIASESAIINAESVWKAKLLSREFGLNRN